jgi:hypothetical protein
MEDSWFKKMSKKITLGIFRFSEAVGFFCQIWRDKGSNQGEKEWLN